MVECLGLALATGMPPQWQALARSDTRGVRAKLHESRTTGRVIIAAQRSERSFGPKPRRSNGGLTASVAETTLCLFS